MRDMDRRWGMTTRLALPRAPMCHVCTQARLTAQLNRGFFAKLARSPRATSARLRGVNVNAVITADASSAGAVVTAVRTRTVALGQVLPRCTLADLSRCLDRSVALYASHAPATAAVSEVSS